MSKFSDLSGCEQISGFARGEPRTYSAEEDACFFAERNRNNKPDTSMSFRVTVTEISGHPSGVEPSKEIEKFRQEFETLDLKKFVVALNVTPRGRKPKPAKEGAK